MLAIAILLLIVGLMYVILVAIMFGDTGMAIAIGVPTAILAGIGFFIVKKQKG